MKIRQAKKIWKRECEGAMYRERTSNRAHSVRMRHVVFSNWLGRMRLMDGDRMMVMCGLMTERRAYCGRKGDEVEVQA